MPILLYVLPGTHEYLVGDVLGIFAPPYFYNHKPINRRLIVVVKEPKRRSIAPNGIFYNIFLAIQHV